MVLTRRTIWILGIIGLVILYLVCTPHIMTFRTSDDDMKEYFESKEVDSKIITTEVDGVPIRIIETGNKRGEALVLIHGSPGSSDAFKEYLADPLLTKRYHMFAVDRPGFGGSDFGTAYSVKQQVNIIAQVVRDNSEPGKVTLMGHSLGGSIAAYVAGQMPEYVERVIIVAGALDPSAEVPALWRRVIAAPVVRGLLPLSLRISNRELMKFQSEVGDLALLLQNIKGHVDVVHAEDDSLVPYSNVAYMKTAFTNAMDVHVTTFPSGDHFVLWNRFDVIRNRVVDQDDHDEREEDASPVQEEVQRYYNSDI